MQGQCTAVLHGRLLSEWKEMGQKVINLTERPNSKTNPSFSSGLRRKCQRLMMTLNTSKTRQNKRKGQGACEQFSVCVSGNKTFNRT